MPPEPATVRLPALLRRDLLIAARRASWLNPPVFLAIVLSLTAVALKALPASVFLAPALLWSGLLLACQLGTESLFNEDFRDGSLEQLLIQPSPSRLLAVRLWAQFVISALPLCLVAPVLALALGMPTTAFPALLTTLPAGTAALVMLGAFGSALALGRGGLLGGVLALPLALPAMLFAVASVEAAATGLEWWPAALRLWLLAGLLAAASPFVIAQVLRLHLE